MKIDDIVIHKVYTIDRINNGKWITDSIPYDYCGARRYRDSFGYYAVLWDEDCQEFNLDFVLDNVFLSLEEAMNECERRNRK